MKPAPVSNYVSLPKHPFLFGIGKWNTQVISIFESHGLSQSLAQILAQIHKNSGCQINFSTAFLARLGQSEPLQNKFQTLRVYDGILPLTGSWMDATNKALEEADQFELTPHNILDLKLTLLPREEIIAKLDKLPSLMDSISADRSDIMSCANALKPLVDIGKELQLILPQLKSNSAFVEQTAQIAIRFLNLSSDILIRTGREVNVDFVHKAMTDPTYKSCHYHIIWKDLADQYVDILERTTKLAELGLGSEALAKLSSSSVRGGMRVIVTYRS